MKTKPTTHPMADMFLALCFAALLSGGVMEVAKAYKTRATCEASGGQLRGDRCTQQGERQ